MVVVFFLHSQRKGGSRNGGKDPRCSKSLETKNPRKATAGKVFPPAWRFWNPFRSRNATTAKRSPISFRRWRWTIPRRNTKRKGRGGRWGGDGSRALRFSGSLGVGVRGAHCVPLSETEESKPRPRLHTCSLGVRGTGAKPSTFSTFSRGGKECHKQGRQGGRRQTCYPANCLLISFLRAFGFSTVFPGSALPTELRSVLERRGFVAGSPCGTCAQELAARVTASDHSPEAVDENMAKSTDLQRVSSSGISTRLIPFNE